MCEAGNLLLDIGPSVLNPRNSEGAFYETADGEILFAYSRYNGDSFSDEASCDIALIRSFDKGMTWSKEDILVHANEFGVQNLMSVSALKLKNGDPSFIFLIKKEDGTIDFGISVSRDAGKSFGKAFEIGRRYIPGYYVMNNDRVERLSDGRVIFPLAQHRMTVPSGLNSYREFESYASACFFQLNEDMMTLDRLPGRIVLDETARSATGVQEPGIVELKNNVIWAYFRTDRGAQYESYSIDGLNTFTPARQSLFTSPPSPMKIKRNPYDLNLYAIWNPIPNYNGRKLTKEGWGRTPMVISISRDDGNTWSDPVVIEDDDKRGYCYPAMHFLPEKQILISYCRGGEGDGACLTRLGIRKLNIQLLM